MIAATGGTEFSAVPTRLGRWGTLICHHRHLPETARILALRQAQLILAPALGTCGQMNDLMMRVRAYESGVWLGFVHPNRCLIVNPKGNVVAANQHDQIVMARIDLRHAKKTFLERRRPELYGDLTNK